MHGTKTKHKEKIKTKTE